ncbi:hypothetical protein D031_3059B, partial [Vibrio parahaemolyticus VP-48]
REEC